MIGLNHIRFAYGDKTVFSDLSFTVKDGECLCLQGPSGQGKTTAARILTGLETAQNGKVTAPATASWVFQEDRLIPHLSVLHNVTLALPKEKREDAVALLEEAGLGEVLKQKPALLSGGMKRRVAIVRAVAFGGDALILDEPFNGLDRDTKKIMASMIRREFLSKGKPVLLISHVEEDAELMNATIFSIKPKDALQ